MVKRAALRTQWLSACRGSNPLFHMSINELKFTKLSTKMKSIKRKIEKKLRRKTSPSLVASIINSKKNSKWHEISALISRPRRKEIKLNQIW